MKWPTWVACYAAHRAPETFSIRSAEVSVDTVPTSMTAPARASCPTCGANLDGAGTGAFCAACMWQAFADPAPAEGVDSSVAPPDAFFRVPGHDVLAEIARGGGGIVYRARQREPRREVALKMLLAGQVCVFSGLYRW